MTAAVTAASADGQGAIFPGSALPHGATRSILLGAAVAEERAVLRISDVVPAMANLQEFFVGQGALQHRKENEDANLGANGAYAFPVDHAAGVAVIPVLGHKLPFRLREGAQALVQVALIISVPAVLAVRRFLPSAVTALRMHRLGESLGSRLQAEDAQQTDCKPAKSRAIKVVNSLR